MRYLIEPLAIFIVLAGSVIGIFAWLIGPVALTIGLSVIGLFLYGAACAVAGAWWTSRTYHQAAQTTIEATNKNDAHDAQKMDALTGLVEAVVRGYAQTQNSMLKTPPPLPQMPYPQLPANSALRFDDAVFEELDG